MDEQTTGLLGFDWDNNIESILGDVQSTPTETNEVNVKPQEVTLSVEEPVNSFEGVEPNQQEETLSVEKDEKVEPVQQESSIYTDVYKDLKDYGILKNVELEEVGNLTAADLEQIYEKDYELEVQKRIKEWSASQDKDFQDFINFKLNGGNSRDFINHISNDENYLPEGNIEDERFQDEIIRFQLAYREGWDDEEVEERLEQLTNNGKKAYTASKYYQRIEQERQLDRERLLEEQERKKYQALQQENEFKNNVSQVLQTSSDINGYKIANKEKQGIYDFITKRNIKVSDTQAVTGFQKKLAETLQDNRKVVLLAKMLMNDFNFKDFEKQVETKVTKQVKSNLENRSGLKSNSSSGSSTNRLNLSSIFN